MQGESCCSRGTTWNNDYVGNCFWKNDTTISPITSASLSYRNIPRRRAPLCPVKSRSQGICLLGQRPPSKQMPCGPYHMFSQEASSLLPPIGRRSEKFSRSGEESRYSRFSRSEIFSRSGEEARCSRFLFRSGALEKKREHVSLGRTPCRDCLPKESCRNSVRLPS